MHLGGEWAMAAALRRGHDDDSQTNVDAFTTFITYTSYTWTMMGLPTPYCCLCGGPFESPYGSLEGDPDLEHVIEEHNESDFEVLKSSRRQLQADRLP